ncbi:MAG TPA: NAD(P)/FAD-dependent oxidoreductase [Candidatus Dormibacteraeota bacterium]|nr:NAD(P)/FAD-dependent oxidoreductase [Candidatus Dormibacteraeota bacterium]
MSGQERAHGDAAAGASAYDAIVVGGGHNGLVAAAYLAKAGVRTLVLERREDVGGAVGTVELAPGVRCPSLAQTVGRLRPSIVRDLGLASHGLSLVAPDVRVFAPKPDGRAVILRADPARTAEGLRDWSMRDAAAYQDADRLVRSLGRFLAELMSRTPPDIAAPGIDDAIGGLALGRTFRGLGRDDSRTLLRVLPMAVADLVGEWFESDAVRAAVAWRGVRYTALGPWSGGSAAVLLMDSAGTDAGIAGATVYARGGPGELARALGSAARAAGAEVRTSAEVGRVLDDGGRARGVELASGERIDARVVVAGIDPKRLLTGLVDPVTIGPSMRWRAGNIRTPGTVAKVDLALSGLPSFPAARGDERLLRGRILVAADGIDTMERAHDAAKYGRLPDAPILEVTIPSLVDPSLVEGAPDGTHVMSVLVQPVPYALAEGDWDSRCEGLAELAMRTLEAVAPGIRSLVTARRVVTPLDLERDWGMTGGHPLHAEPTLDSWYAWRPLLGWARYRMPVDGLYLAGSGAHPGGGVTGWPGRNAARQVLADRRRWSRA